MFGHQASQYKLRYYQDDALGALFYAIDNNKESSSFVVAMPTGTGKSLVIAEFCKRVLRYTPTARILMMTHVKELIEQNAEKLLSIWDTAPLGIHSAGLKKRESIMPIIYGGVKSIHSSLEKGKHASLRNFDYVLIDECHLLSPKADAVYQSVLSIIRANNQDLKVIGLTATPYRYNYGSIVDNKLFDTIVYDLTSKDNFSRLISEGYLCPLVTRETYTKIDVDKVAKSKGDYNIKQLEARALPITERAIGEAVKLGSLRKKWLVFCAGVDHAEHVSNKLTDAGITNVCVHSGVSRAENTARINKFLSGEFLALVNNNMLTTGFDCPDIDLILMLRPTVSVGLWIQMLGRGTRPSPNKENCLVLDFAHNAKLLGTIDEPKIRKKLPSTASDNEKKVVVVEQGGLDFKECPKCKELNSFTARRCATCGFFFLKKLKEVASNQNLITGKVERIIETHMVKLVEYVIHQKPNSTPTLKVTYRCDNMESFSEWICFEHFGYAREKAIQWWSRRASDNNKPPPVTIKEAYFRAKTELTIPKSIDVWTNHTNNGFVFPRIIGYIF